MIDAAARDGVTLAFGKDQEIASGYRTRDQQILAKTRTPDLAADPGTSTHEFGAAVDFNLDTNMVGLRNTTKDNTEKARKIHNWLKKNADKYGFAPYGENWEMDVNDPEAWHWDYVGGTN